MNGIAAYLCLLKERLYDKLSLEGMQLPDKYKEKFDVSSEDPALSGS
jgi:hypothetical protein